MRERKIHGLLVLIEPEERQLFRDFLVSPLFEPSKTMQEFFGLWEEWILDPDEENLPPVNYTAESFLEGSRLLPSRIDKYCSQLYKKALEFLAWRQYMQSPGTQLEHTAEALELRGASRKEWEAQRERLRDDIDASGLSSDQLLRHLDYEWKEAESRIHSRETQSIWQEDFHGLHEAIDQYYRLQKLKLAIATANARLIYNQPQDTVPDLPLEIDPATAAHELDALSYGYWLTLQLYLSEEGTGEFDTLFTHLQAEQDNFAKEESREIFNYALNFCLRRGSTGEERYLKRAAALYRELLANGIFLVDGKVAPQAMKNIVVIHCLVGEMDWVSGFLEEFKDRLQGEPNPNIIRYNRAVLAFYRKDRNSIEMLKELISQLKDDVFYELDSRIYLLKAYFEHLPELTMDELDDMYRMYDSFRIYISRNQMISEMHKQRYRNFITQFRRFLKLLEDSPSAPDLKRLRALREKITTAEFMANKRWFLEKIDFYLEPA